MRPDHPLPSVARPLTILPPGSTSDFAWLGMRKFHNPDQTTSSIMRVRRIPPKHKSNVRKQMQQLKYCLVQAKEYFDAAQSASLATRPLHLYYSCMSLALAEILWKGDGSVSIDRLRERHSHHGLQLTPPRRMPSALTEAGGALRAKPFVARDGDRIGTFEIWHRYARHLPVIGTRTIVLKGGGHQSGPRSIFTSVDRRSPVLPDNGISFLDCINRLPYMRHHLPHLSERSRLIRAKVVETVDERPDIPRMRGKITVQPNYQDLIDNFFENIYIDANAVDQINCTQFSSGFSVDWTFSLGIDDVYVSVPKAFSVSQDEVYFIETDYHLNEFCHYYVALFILGMFSRYYPDLWHREIESSTDLSIAAECLLNAACSRLPVLSLGELEGIYFLSA